MTKKTRTATRPLTHKQVRKIELPSPVQADVLFFLTTTENVGETVAYGLAVYSTWESTGKTVIRLQDEQFVIKFLIAAPDFDANLFPGGASVAKLVPTGVAVEVNPDDPAEFTVWTVDLATSKRCLLPFRVLVVATRET
jgi:hypothetical protein